MRTKWLEMWLAALLAATFALNFAWTLQQPLWSPRDEIAHFDYIAKLSAGRLPLPDEPISDETFAMCLEFTWTKPANFDGTRQTMGLAGTSYEAWQPPLYYALLTPPNLMLEHFGAPPRLRITVLRLFQLLLVQAGLVVLVAAFAGLQHLGAASRVVGWLVAIGLSLCGTHQVYSLGNDNLSPLLGALFVWCHVRHLRTGRPVDLWAAAFVAGLGFWGKYTNGLLIPMHAAACLLAPRAGVPRSLGARLATVLLPVGMVLVLLVHNQLRFGDALNTSITESRFAPLVLSTTDIPLFLTFLIHDSLRIASLHSGDPLMALPTTRAWWWVFGALFATNGLLLGISAMRRSWGPRQTFVAAACGVTAAILGAASILNLYKPVANWFLFRHFLAYGMFWLLAVGYAAMRPPERVGAAAAILGAVAATVCVTVAWARVF